MAHTTGSDYRSLIFNFPFWTFKGWFSKVEELIREASSSKQVNEIRTIAGEAVFKLFVMYHKDEMSNMCTKIDNACVAKKCQIKEERRKAKRRRSRARREEEKEDKVYKEEED